MQLNPSPKVRVIVYIIIVMGTSIIAPLNALHVINDVVMTVWTSMAGAASFLAALNVNTK